MAASGAGRGQVDMLVDLGRHLGDDQQPRDAAVAHGDRLGADRHQHVVLQRRATGWTDRPAPARRRRRPRCPAVPPASAAGNWRSRARRSALRRSSRRGPSAQQLGRQPARQRHRPGRAASAPLRPPGCPSWSSHSMRRTARSARRRRLSRKAAAGGRGRGPAAFARHRRKIGDRGAFANFAHGRIGRYGSRHVLQRSAPWTSASAQRPISSPAFAPTIVTPSMRPLPVRRPP